MTSSNRQKYWT